MSVQSPYAISKILDLAVLELPAAFFIGVLAFDLAYFGFHVAIIAIPHDAELFFEVLPCAIPGLLLWTSMSNKESWTTIGWRSLGTSGSTLLRRS